MPGRDVLKHGTMNKSPRSWRRFDDYAVEFALERLLAGERVALITLVKIEGSSPRPLGAQMAVSETGEWVGYLSGGCIERPWLRRRSPRSKTARTDKCAMAAVQNIWIFNFPAAAQSNSSSTFKSTGPRLRLSSTIDPRGARTQDCRDLAN